MHTTTRKCAGAGLLISALLVASSPAQAVVMNIVPNLLTSNTGASVEMDIEISGLGDFAPDSMGVFDLNIAFDSSRLSVDSFLLGPLLGDFDFFEAADFSLGDLGGGTLNLSVLSFLTPTELDALQPERFSLATVVFEVIDLEPGTSTTVTIDPALVLGDAFGAPLPLDGVGNATINNPALVIPEPAALALLGLGMTALVLVRRRCRL
jgi:PEP-CTERM motif